jgi:uncharacterized protein
MKRVTTILNLILASTLVLNLVAIGYPTFNALAAPPSEIPNDPDRKCNTGRSVQVSGTAVVNVMPDRALIQLGVQSNGITPNKVESANSATIDRVLRALEAQGIENKDIVTDWYVITPIYDNYDSLTIDGYRINNVVAVTLRDMSKVNSVIIAALNAGANQVINVDFYLSDLRTYRDQARELAMNAAKEKAQDLAAAAGVETGCVLSIHENTWSHYYGGWYGHGQNLWTQNVVQNVPASGGEAGDLTEAGPVNPGQISVRAEVSASFSLDER